MPLGSLGEAFIDILPSTAKFAGKLESDVKEAVNKVESSSTSAFGNLANVGQKAFLGLSAAAVGFGAAAVKAALEGQEATAQLRQVVENTGTSFDKFEPKVESLSGSFAKFGYQNDQVEGALARLIGITGNSSKSLELMATAADLAAARHLDLTAAAQLVGRAADGNVTALKRMGIEVQVTGDKAKDGAAAIAQLNERFGGAAQAQADTYAGKLKAFRAETENLIEKVGNVLLPILANLAGDASGIIGFFEHNTAAAAALAVVIGGPLAVAIAAYIVQEGILIAVKLADFFETAAIAALYAAEAIAGAASAIYASLGPVGLLLAALEIGVVAFTNWGNAARDAGKHFADSFVVAISSANDPIALLRDEIANIQKAQDAYIDSIVLKNNVSVEEAKQYAATNEVYKANQAAIGELNKKVKDLTTAHAAQAAATETVAAAGEDLTGKQADLAQQLGLTTEQVSALAKKLGVDLAKDTGDAADKIGALASRVSEASPATLALSDALGKLSDRTNDATARVSAFKTALDLLIGGNLDAEKAVVNLYDKIDTLGEKLKANGVNFDLHTKASRENATAIENTVEAIRTHIDTMQQSSASADDMRKALDGDTQALDDQLKKAGYTADQITALNQQYGLVPESINTVLNADPSAAIAAIQKATEEYQHWQGIVERTVSIGGGPGGGSTVRVFDTGGWVDAPAGAPVPAIVHGGEFVLSREMLARGEGPSSGGGGNNITVNQTFAAGTDKSVVDHARDEMMRVLSDLVNRAGTGTGTV